MNFEKKSPILIAAIYFLVGTSWIYFSNSFLAHLTRSPREMFDWAIYKGWLYVGVTTILLYVLIRMYGVRLLACKDEAAEKLRLSEARLKSVIENLPFDFWVSDREGRCIMQNSVSVKNWGICIGKKIDEMGKPQYIAACWKNIHQRMLNGEVVTNEADCAFNSVRSYRYDIIGPVRDNDAIWGATGVSIDVTQLKRAEEALL